VEVLKEGLPDHRVSVDGDSDLLEHGVDVSRELVLSAFSHDYKHTTSVLYVHADVLQLLCSEGHLRSTQEEEVALSEALEVESRLINFALVTAFELLD